MHTLRIRMVHYCSQWWAPYSELTLIFKASDSHQEAASINNVSCIADFPKVISFTHFRFETCKFCAQKCVIGIKSSWQHNGNTTTYTTIFCLNDKIFNSIMHEDENLRQTIVTQNGTPSRSVTKCDKTAYIFILLAFENLLGL